MAGPRPKTNNGTVQLSYQSGTLLTHKCNLDVTINNPGGPSPLLLTTASAGSVDWRVATAAALPLIQDLFGTDAGGFAWTLFHFTGGTLIPIDSYAPGGLGTSGLTQAAEESTFFFYDTFRRADKIVFLETRFPGPNRSLLAGLAPAESAFVTDVLDQTSPHIGSWYQSKSGAQTPTFLARTRSYNRRLRRKLGLG